MGGWGRLRWIMDPHADFQAKKLFKAHPEVQRKLHFKFPVAVPGTSAPEVHASSCDPLEVSLHRHHHHEGHVNMCNICLHKILPFVLPLVISMPTCDGHFHLINKTKVGRGLDFLAHSARGGWGTFLESSFLPVPPKWLLPFHCAWLHWRQNPK